MTDHPYQSTVTGDAGLNGTMIITTDGAANNVVKITYQGTLCTILPGNTRQSLQFIYPAPDSFNYSFHGGLVNGTYHGACVRQVDPPPKAQGKPPGGDPDNWTATSTGSIAGAAAHGKTGY